MKPTNEEQIQSLEMTISMMKADWGAKCNDDFAFGCYECYATMVVKFLEAYLEDLKNGNYD